MRTNREAYSTSHLIQEQEITNNKKSRHISPGKKLHDHSNILAFLRLPPPNAFESFLSFEKKMTIVMTRKAKS